MRAVSNTLLALLVLGALLWGNCFSCPQLLLSLGTQSSSHGCCQRPGSARSECHSLALKHFVKADGAQQAAPQAVPCEPIVTAALVARTLVDTTVAAQASPPDPAILNSSFRV